MRFASILIGLTLALLACAFVATALGAVSVPLDRIVAMVLGLPGDPAEATIIFQIRLPRVVAGVLVGGALAAAGVVFQGLLRNPMADPYIIGTSGGAALGVTLALLIPAGLLPAGFSATPLFAFGGALAAVLIVYNIARVGRRTPITTLLLAGFAVSSMLAAVMSFLMLVGGNTLRQVILWTMGGLAVTGWSQVLGVAPLILLGLAATIPFAQDLNLLLLGEEQATTMGLSVERRKLLLLALGSFLTAAAVSISGLVGFVGLVVPHVTRLMLGPDHRLLLPAATLVGALFLVLADLIARTITAPAEMPVGIITALVGAPFFIYLLRRNRRDYDF
jgi:iron complex transport system permease protein